MASMEGAIYKDVYQLGLLANKVVEGNYSSDTDLGEQADLLDEIAELAARAGKASRAVNKALGG